MWSLGKENIEDLKKTWLREAKPGVLKTIIDLLTAILYISLGLALILGLTIPSFLKNSDFNSVAITTFTSSVLTLVFIYIFDRLQAKKDHEATNENLRSLHRVIDTYEKEFEKRNIAPPKKTI